MALARRTLRHVLPVALALAAVSSVAPTAPAAPRSCADGYTYAGRLSATRAHGVRATLTALARPQVTDGHVAAWVGVGGVGEGPNGTDAWIQIGLSAFPEGDSTLYYEVTRPNASPTYHAVELGVRPGQRFRVAVLEMGKRRDHWRVWVNGEPVSEPVLLPESHGRWQPIATAESWAGSGSACNTFAYGFEGLRVSSAPGGNWRTFVGGYTFLDSGYRVIDRGRAAFLAKSA
jgi:hypothetical protein